MIRLRIQARLTLWYLLSVTIIVALFATGSWYSMKASMYHSIDNDLSYRMGAVIPFIESHSLDTPDSFNHTFANSSDSSIVGVFVQITDADSRMLYESDVLATHFVPIFPRGAADGSVTRSTVRNRGWTVRIAARRIIIHGREITVHVVEPLSDLLNSLHELTLYFASLIPLALLLTAFTGYWISRRALAPVEQIRREADAIDPTHLTTRLKTPRNDDELGLLARTLNSMLARIEAGFRSVERFTADASHELRAPLAFIITAADVSLRRQRSSEELADVLRKILLEARRMSKLVEDLLALARGDAGPVGTASEPVDMRLVVEQAVDQMQPAASAKHLELRLTATHRRLDLCGNESELRRLILILLDNAIKYTDAGVISVGLAAGHGNVNLAVSDTGVGIEQSALSHIFDRFWRADKVRSRAEGGVGLGLSLAAQIVRRHHGTLSVDSVFGEGSTFSVQLPASSIR